MCKMIWTMTFVTMLPHILRKKYTCQNCTKLKPNCEYGVEFTKCESQRVQTAPNMGYILTFIARVY